MKAKIRSILLLSALLVVVFPTAIFAQETDPTPADVGERTGISLAIYNQGRALVQDSRTISLSAGENAVNFTDVAAGIDPTTVTVVSLTDPTGTYVIEQNYVFDLVNSSALLQRYLDQTIMLVTNDGTEFRGELLSGRNGEIILRQEDGQVAVLSLVNVRDLSFPELPGGLITRPTLRWLIGSEAGGEQDLQLTYLTSGLTWTADYNILLATDNTSLDLNGWVTLTNTSGTSYENAQVKLIAGDVNQIQAEVARMSPPVMYDAMSAMPTPSIEQRDISEYKLYEIQRLVTVADNETKQVEFVTGADVPANTFFVYNASYPYYGGGPVYDQYYGMSGITDVQTYLEFTTDEDGGLGADLPAGRVRVYQSDVDGAPVLIGENRIDHTPEGEDVELFLGNAFDLVGERTQTNFNLIASNVLEETYEIRLRNRKDSQAVEIRVPENLSRWTNWEIIDSSMEYTQLNSGTIEFRANVEPGGETVITYTVRYTFPR